MEPKVLTIHDLADLNYVAEEVITTAQFRFWEIDEEGNCITFGMPSEERHARLMAWMEEMKHNYLCFRENEELHKIGVYEALNMSFAEVRDKYLGQHLAKLRNILRKDPFCVGVIASVKIPDDYLDDLLIMKWLDTLRLWAVQWDEQWCRTEDDGDEG